MHVSEGQKLHRAYVILLYVVMPSLNKLSKITSNLREKLSRTGCCKIKTLSVNTVCFNIQNVCSVFGYGIVIYLTN